jgi:NTE family protein
MRLLSRILLGCCLVACQLPAGAQQPAGEAATPRPRIGLVLSGGGARGAAHVGVLKLLDELHVPVDAIAGTSMGAVVGGLYASGYSGREIEQILNGVDWQDAFRDRPKRSDLSMRRKREDEEFLVQLPLGLRDGKFQLPRGLVQGQKLSLLLRELTQRAARTDTFDHLPTPFRAVATDLETGQPVIMDRGDLATAIRASMSVPGLFTPVEREGRVLVDGGVSENLPIDAARAMNVDVLIVVDVGFPLSSRERLGSVASVSNQMLAILIRRDAQRQRATLGLRDIVIDPPLGDTSSFDFTRIVNSIEQGEIGARAQLAKLAALALAPAEYERYAARRHAGEAPAPVVRAVRAEAGSEDYAGPIGALFGDFAGEPFDAARVRGRVSRLYGQGTLEALDYTLVPVDPQDPDSPVDLSVRARRNSWGPNYVRVGLRLQDDFAGNSSFDAAARFVMTELNRYGAEWTWDLQVGANPKLATELFLPFSYAHRWFASPHATFQIRNVPQIVNEEQVGELRVRSALFGIDLGREIGNTAELRAGIEREVGSSRVRLGDTAAPREEFRTREYFTRYTYDSIDSAAFPRNGNALTLQWRGVLRDQAPDRISDSLDLDLRFVRSSGRNTAILWASAGTLLEPAQASARSFFSLGGFLNLSGLTPDALQGPHFAITRLVYYRKVGSGGEGFLNVPLYAGMSVEAGNTWASRSDISFGSSRKDASLFFGADTFLGPAFIAAGYDDHGRSAFYLFLGRGF